MPFNELKIKNWLLLIGLTLLSTAVFEHSKIDLFISSWFYYDGHWLIQKGLQPFRFIFYDIPKLSIITIAIGVPLLKYKRIIPLSRLEIIYLVLCLGAVPTIIAILKGLTHVSCPNQLSVFGGTMPYLSLWQDIMTKTDNKCFPAAHPSSGFALYAFAYLPRFRQYKYKIIYIVSFIAWTMGLYKMIIGDHFFSHTLVSMWLSWGIVYGLALWFFKSHAYNTLP